MLLLLIDSGEMDIIDECNHETVVDYKSAPV